MSERFEIVALECLGPYSKAVLKEGIFSTDIKRLLQFNNLNWVEKIILGTCQALPDNKKTFILLFQFALKRKISLRQLEIIYIKLDLIRLNLINKISKYHESVDKELVLNLTRTMLLSKYSSHIVEKFLNICSELIYFPLFPSVNVQILILSESFECFQGFVIRGQCRYNTNNSFTGHIAILPTLNPMTIQYQGSLEDMYQEKLESYKKLVKNLEKLQIRVLITETCHDWIKDACVHTGTQLFESSHPLDLSHFLQSVNPLNSDIFLYFHCSGTIGTQAHQSILRIFCDFRHFSVIFPEILGNDYQSTLEDLIKMWRVFHQCPWTVNSGLNFEIAFSKEVEGTGLDLAIFEYIRKFIEKLPRSGKIWEEFLVGSLGNDLFFVECGLGTSNKCRFRNGESGDLECFEAK